MSARDRLRSALKQLRGALNKVSETIHFERLTPSERATLEATLARLHEDEAFLCRDISTVKR